LSLDFDQRQLLGPLTDFLEQREDNVEVYHFARVWPEIRQPPLLEDHEEGEAIDEDQQLDSRRSKLSPYAAGATDRPPLRAGKLVGLNFKP
jgi:hypothetical protein